MSTLKGIFEPFKPYVQDQLRLRRKILSSKNVGVGALPQEFFTYNSKQCVIRMASGVDLRGDSDNPNPILDTNSIDPTVAEYESSLHGSNCARNWVLESGIIDINKRVYREFTDEELNELNAVDPDRTNIFEHYYQGKLFATSTGNVGQPLEIIDSKIWGDVIGQRLPFTTQGQLAEVIVGETSDKTTAHRGGIGTSGVYGDPKVRADRDANDTYGIVPMPGITDATIRTKSDDGSLREAQVNFMCHNRRQLEILEALYMRPGYPILLEWGWNPYLVANPGGRSSESIEQFGDVLEEFFDPSSDFTGLNLMINRKKVNASGNYDGFIGYVKNFNFKATPLGGFECTTEIIAQGEILESLKSQKVVIPENIADSSNEDATSKLVVYDQFWYILKSMQEVLDRQGDEDALNIMGTDLETKSMFDSWDAFWGEFLWAGDGSTGTTSANTQDKDIAAGGEGKGVTDILENMDPVADTFLAGFSLVAGLVQKILKVSQKELKEATKRNQYGLRASNGGTRVGYDAFLFGTLIQEISLVEDAANQNTQATNNDDNTNSSVIDKKEKHILVRWDLLCQIINHLCTEGYKEKHEPLVELTYLNPNQRTYESRTMSSDGQISYPTGSGRDLRFYLEYATPAERNSLHPTIDDEDLKKILGQSFDPAVCIMPHQFHDSLIVEKYDTTYKSPLAVAEVTQSQAPAGSGPLLDEGGEYEGNPLLGDFEGMSRQELLDQNNQAFAVAESTGDPIRDQQIQNQIDILTANIEEEEYSFEAQVKRNEEENYQPLTSFTNTKFSNRSIGLIYFNLEYLLSSYEQMRMETVEGEKRLKKDFVMMDFIKKIWGDVNEACAGYYNFDIQTEHERPHVARIIDKTVSGEPPANIFEFNPQGLNSIVRDFVFSSKIDNDIASTISIAAQAPNNIDSLEALSFKSFHKNIKNRFTDNSLTPDFLEAQRSASSAEATAKRLALEKDLKKYEGEFKNLKNYQERSNRQYRAVFNEGDSVYVNYINYSAETAKNVARDIEELLVSINSRYPLFLEDGKTPHPKAGYYNPEATNERNAIIPLNFDIQMDGISGISPLNIFKIKSDKLPLAYQRDDIAFIVKGEKQKITAGQDWILELDGQLTLLNSNQIVEGANVIEDGEQKKENEKKKEADEEDKKSEEPEIKDGEDPSPKINTEKVGSTSPTNSPLYKKYKFDLGFGRGAATAADSTFAKIKPYIDRGELVLVGDNATNSKFLKTRVLTTTTITGGKFYLHKGCANKFKSWMAELDSKGINYQISAALRWGKNTGKGAHGYGLAVDFNNLYQDTKAQAKSPKKYNDVKKVAANLEARKQSSTYKEIAKIGKKYGWYNPWRLADASGTEDELWHFEYWGDPA